MIRELTGQIQQVAESLAPAIVTGLIAGGAGFLILTPSRRREKVAAAEAKSSA